MNTSSLHRERATAAFSRIGHQTIPVRSAFFSNASVTCFVLPPGKRLKEALVSVLIALPGDDCLDENLHVESKRPVIDIVQVVLHSTSHLFQRIRFAPEPVYLRPSGDSRLDVMP